MLSWHWPLGVLQNASSIESCHKIVLYISGAYMMWNLELYKRSRPSTCFPHFTACMLHSTGQGKLERKTRKKHSLLGDSRDHVPAPVFHISLRACCTALGSKDRLIQRPVSSHFFPPPSYSSQRITNCSRVDTTLGKGCLQAPIAQLGEELE